MITTYIHRIGWFVGLALLQVLILNNIHIGGYATPFLYIYFILKFDSGCSRNELMLWAFFFGLTIDIFADTPGMNAAATVLFAFLRPSLLRLFTPRDNLESFVPSFATMGWAIFIKYTITGVFIHCLALLSIEFFSFSAIWLLLLRVAACTVLTVTCIAAIEGMRS
ncbi:rod shape-determining protein MreD [Bacteroides pyogenes F0041]|uniref:Rod shape-determining protein MreD n=1 Tax=Bacteroides pyogenes F0041 TaxID=1321819 RepID=U2CN07_9BACE|nr:rod shape-determining protein MreD [Bacteroides pyogenes]ERI85930.1 rod shape-determining protein MreD [Bacteroides pyogenes F0041]MBB3896500.1 rod shape-determining protein MreD [Bacteroides pyogenes]GAE23798.1 rod shape-determining protein MreD [Bacteroides pyogenes JCM 10003]SUV36229.1 rod shape-determining protein MreD [Bacteroides pyogenes]